MITAEQNIKIVESQNFSDIKTAEVNLEVARLRLEEYDKGTYPQYRRDYEGQINIAKGDLDLWVERSDWSGACPGRAGAT